MLSFFSLQVHFIYFEMNVVILKLALRNKGRLHRTKLCAFWDASLCKNSTQEAVHVEDQRQAGTSF